MEEKINQWGTITDDVTVSGSSSFGLNTGYITEIKFEESTDPQKGDRVSFTVNVDGKTYYGSAFEPKGELYHGGERITPDNENYPSAMNRERNKVCSYIINLVKSLGISQEVINNQFKDKPGIESFKKWCETVLVLIPKEYAKIKIHLFLEYQFTFSEGYDTTFLSIPRNLSYGKVFNVYTPAPGGGEWKAVTDERGLHYEAGNGKVYEDIDGLPIFHRNKSYMESVRAKRQTRKISKEGTTPSVSMSTNTEKSIW